MKEVYNLISCKNTKYIINQNQKIINTGTKTYEIGKIINNK